MMAPYNGHPSWNHWNVSLWINNDEGLYNLARDCIKQTRRSPKPRRAAASLMLRMLDELGTAQTPDGARYTVERIQHAMRGL